QTPAVVGALEVAREEPLLGLGVPAENLNVGPLHLVVVLDAGLKAVHEDGDGGQRDAAEGADDTRLGHAGGQVASQEGSLIGGEEDVPDVLNGRIVGV